MGANRGSFGLLKPRYEVTSERVTISRPVWVSVVMLAMAAPGIWCFQEALNHPRSSSNLLWVGFVGIMAGVIALVMTPWLMPGKIVVSRDGIVWGGTKFTRDKIVSVKASATQVRSTPYNSYQAWSIFVSLANGKPLILSFGGRNRWASADRLNGLANAMTAALGPR